MQLTIRPLTLDLWPAFEDLFGKSGACNGCWCMYWRIGSEYHKRAREKNRSAFRKIVKQGPPPGLLAFDGFPSFTLEPLAQLYRRIDEKTYSYESNRGEFATELSVNEADFVTRYPNLWEIEAGHTSF